MILHSYRRIGRRIILSLTLTVATCVVANAQQSIDLAGKWTVALDSLDIGEGREWAKNSFSANINLPGTLDGAGLGEPNMLKPALTKPQLTHLTRKHSYIGAAWYTKEISIPKDWKDKKIGLKLERVLWKTQVWVDGKKVDVEQNSLIAPHYFDLTNYLTPGKTQRLTLKIDNRKFFDLSYDNMAHAYTNHTQIIWNGVIGDIQLTAENALSVADVQVFSSLANKNVQVKAVLRNDGQRSIKRQIVFNIRDKADQSIVATQSKDLVLAAGINELEFTMPVNSAIKPWDEFHPNLYTLESSIKESQMQKKETDFAFRDFTTSGKTFLLNGKPIFLRGTLECNIFPLTGHPPMEKKEWKKLFQTAKNWGLNHIRFHSWCPPEAAFQAADDIGMYLQVELPIWSLTVGELQSTTAFLYQEADRMIKEYGNHPSFMLWSMGNELQGKMEVLNKMVDVIKRKDSRHLYANTSFTFEKGHGDRPEKNDDFFVTQWTTDGWVRGQGVFNDQSPSFNKNYNAALVNVHVPVVTHEIGQYAVYPNLNEIDKYTGVLDPLNFKAIREDLQAKGMINQADDFLTSSGKLAAILYKEEIERALKTAGISGFQLLDLHDFPGQGTALVGLLDAFWDSKGILDSTEFKNFNAPLVPLLNFEKATYKNTETFHGAVAISNYFKEFEHDQAINWKIVAGDKELKSGQLSGRIALGFNDLAGKISLDLNEIKVATKLTVTLSLAGTNFQNSWNIWVYPDKKVNDYGKVFYTQDVQEAMRQLRKGKKVLLNPDWKTIEGLEGKFVPVFWSPVHFPKQAGSMGLLLDNTHAAFNDFPTDNHTDWQWWDLHRKSTTLVLDSLEGGTPLIQMVDNFANNRKLALAVEGEMHGGKLMIVSIDLATDLEGRPVANQLLKSILTYMNSENFEPEKISNPSWLEAKLKARKKEQAKQDATAIY